MRTEGGERGGENRWSPEHVPGGEGENEWGGRLERERERERERRGIVERRRGVGAPSTYHDHLGGM